MNQLGIFVLSYNRPEFIRQAIDSILNQSFKNFDLIISDNSSNEQVQKVIAEYKHIPNVTLLRRWPSMDPIGHFNQIITEGKAYNHFMMFHDDDLMLPNCVEKMMNIFTSNQEIVAVCCNAFNKYSDNKVSTLFNPYYKNDLRIENSKILINRYLTKTLSHPPFPFYIYNTKKIGNSKMNSVLGGKHCDVSFLCQVADQGPLYWTAEPLGYYRRHANNDSNFISFADLISLSQFIFKRYKSFYFKMSFILLKRTVSYFIALVRNFLIIR